MPLFALLFVVVPLLELYVLVQVAQSIGVVEALALLVVMTFVGVWLVKSQGLAILRRVSTTVRNGQAPHREMIDGALVLLAGVLLIFPGFVTDVVGLFLLFPPTRALVRGSVVSRVTAVRIIDAASTRFPYSGRNRPTDTREVWEAESWETDARDSGTDDFDDPGPRGGELGR